jgi:hypothetical protein
MLSRFLGFFKLSVYSGYQLLVRCICGKDFLQFCGWHLQFRDNFICCAGAFLFYVFLSVNPFA